MSVYDSNLLIYSFQSAYNFLQSDLLKSDVYVSAITKLEVLGYPLISVAEKAYFERLFSLINILPIDEAIIAEAINLRQMRKMSVGDAIIAATAQVNHFGVYTHNATDFNWIKGLNVIDPIAPK